MYVLRRVTTSAVPVKGRAESSARRGENVQHTSSLALAAFSLSLAFRLDDGLHRVAWQRAPVALLAAGARACAHEVVIEELGDVFLERDLHDAAMIGNPRQAEAIRGDQRRS
jgi:hypothetical protein